jgi:hypothetical protein
MPSADSPERCAEPSARMLELMGEIHVRLAPICTETPPALFNEMVLRIARVQLRFENAPCLKPARPPAG